MTPEPAAAILVTLPLLIRLVAAHFREPELALNFARLCEEEAGRLRWDAGETARLARANQPELSRDPWRGWR